MEAARDGAGSSPQGDCQRILRRLLAFNKSFACTDVQIGDAGLFYKSQNKKSAPPRRGPASILDIDETGVPVKFQSQTFKGRDCAQERKGGRRVRVMLSRIPFVNDSEALVRTRGVDRGESLW